MKLAGDWAAGPLVTTPSSFVPPGERRRIAMLLPRSDVAAGASAHVAVLGRALLERGHECRVFVGGSGPHDTWLLDRRIPVERVKGLSRAVRPHADLRALVDFTRRMKAFEPDVIAAHTAKAGALARVTGRILGQPVVYTPHGWPFLDGVPAGSARRSVAIERLSARLGGQVVVVSEYERTFGIAKRIGRPEHMTTIRNGIPDVSPAMLAAPDRSPPQIIMVARFDEQKDHDTAIKALHHLAHLDWSLVLVGAGERMETVKTIVSAVGLRDRVQFVGQSDDVTAHLSLSQIFLLASKWESFPLSVLEAMRAGLPTVVTDVGGAREMGEPGVSGLLVDRGDEVGLANALGRLIVDPSLRTQMGRAGRHAYETRHTQGPMIDQTVALYESVSRAKATALRSRSNGGSAHTHSTSAPSVN